MLRRYDDLSRSLLLLRRLMFAVRGLNWFFVQKRAAEKKDAETMKKVAVQVDDLLSFRQFSKKSVDEAIDVCCNHESSTSTTLTFCGSSNPDRCGCWTCDGLC